MKTHELKTDSHVFGAVARGDKTFEIRLNDRDYEVGDVLILKETEHGGNQMKQGAPLIYTGSEHECVVTYILAGPIYGLAEGWVIMSIGTIIDNP